jgi:MSHA biogenesis protein MshQ
MEFDGSSTFINCGDAPEINFHDAMTVSAWIKVREFNKPFQAIVTKGDTAWRLQRQGETGLVTFTFNTGALVGSDGLHHLNLISKRRVDDGQWHHLVGVTDGHQAALYLDGEQESSADAQAIAQNNQPVMIGLNSEDHETRFNGWIDEVRLYGYGLSQAEVTALYRGGGETFRAEK